MSTRMCHVHFRLAFTVLLLGASVPAAWADGTLTHMSGTVSILKADGKSVTGVQGAKAGLGDTVITGVGGFVRMEMTDGSEMVLRPDSQLKIEAYKFAAAQPTEDSFIFSMLKGGMRTVTGLIGKRGNQDAYKLKTSTATIGIRGTMYDLRVCQGNCGSLADGSYLVVRIGAVQASNAQGSLLVGVGQAAFLSPLLAPIILPRDPGIGFTPPAVIPKLDEKKKAQSNTTAATSEQGSGGTTESAGKTDASASTLGSTQADTPASKPTVEADTGAVTPPPSPVAPSDAGANCSIE